MGLLETEQALRWVILSSIRVDDASVISAQPESVPDVSELIGCQVSLAARASLRCAVDMASVSGGHAVVRGLCRTNCRFVALRKTAAIAVALGHPLLHPLREFDSHARYPSLT